MISLFRRQPKNAHAAILFIVLAAFTLAFVKTTRQQSTAGFQTPEIAPLPGGTAPDISTHFVSSSHNIHTHAASLVELGDGRIRAFWFAGSREGAEDVDIRTAIFDPENNRWGAESTIATREGTQRSLMRYVKKLGNPVAQRAGDGTLWLFYVTVSLGGWAGSSITAVTSKDDGATWSPARRLVTSPFLNISTLVKGTPFFYDDGSLGLPAYHEFVGKFGELLRISSNGKIIDKLRLSSGKFSLQPIVLIKNSQQAIAMMRYSGVAPRRLISTTTDDGGQHWSIPVKTALANPDAAVSGVMLHDGKILLAINNTEHGRDALSLVISGDGGSTWTTVYQLEEQRGLGNEPRSFLMLAAQLAKATDAGITDASIYAESAKRSKCSTKDCGFEFSYPYLIQTRSGDLHLVYTWNRSYIKHVRFTRAWLDQRLEKPTDAILH
jgi:predicted neuraminidase